MAFSSFSEKKTAKKPLDCPANCPLAEQYIAKAPQCTLYNCSFNVLMAHIKLIDCSLAGSTKYWEQNRIIIARKTVQ